MARIPESEIERLKAEVSLERLAESRGVVLKRHGADLLGLCPFHDDREPSLVISPAKNLWHCLGACQAGGTVIDWVMRAEGVSFRHAVELLREGIPALAADSGSQPAPAIPAKRGTVCKLGAPVAVVIQSTSAAGKSSLMDAVLALLPEEDRVKYSAMTGQSLFYLGETHMKHKVLAIVEEEGAARASYASKLLQSEGELTIASTGKDPQTGNLITQSYRVEGPVMLFLTTTAVEIDEELLNRCLVLSVDEGREQTRAIRRRQRLKRTLEGLLARQEREHLLALHRNVQRLLRPLAVVNPYAPHLSFLDERTRTRRDHEKYLTLIDAIALLHQYQRPVKTVSRNGRTLEYLEATLADLETAHRLAHEVLGRSLDELPPQTRQLLLALDAWGRNSAGCSTSGAATTASAGGTCALP